jgi:ATP-dependent DNA ligase
MCSITMIKPMLAAAGPLPADSGRWAYEVKWDGFRAVVRASSAGMTVMSRNREIVAMRWGELAPLRCSPLRLLERRIDVGETLTESAARS